MQDEHSAELKKVLSAWDLFFMGLGAIIGTGIFVLTGIAAATQAGPAIIISFLLAGTTAAFAAFAYAELSGMLGGSGSAYGYARVAFGDKLAWLIGWTLLLEYAVCVSAVSTGWSGYLVNGLQAVGIFLPEMWTKPPALGGVVNLPAMLIIFVLMLLLIRGVKESARLNAGIVFIKLLTIFVFLAIGIGYVNPENWSPFMPFGWYGENAEGKSIGVLAAASLVFFAFVGFDAVSTAAEEAKNPQRDLPRGILWSLAVCAVIYVLVSATLTGMVKYDQLNVPSRVAHALSLVVVNWASALIATGAIAGLTTVMLVMYYGLSRILMAMSRDGLLPSVFGEVSTRQHTPIKNIVLSGGVMMLMAGFVPLGSLAELVNIGTLFAFVIVSLAVVVLRRQRPDLPRSFVIPGGVTIPLLGVVFCGGLMAFLPADTWWRFGIWSLLGIVLYLLYGSKKISQSKRILP
jgi:APA family basic amino acid/polyamine antiporter